ncbi:MAG TPA: class I SAM-dependent methyltransferase [Baekduia sp.]|nr:class I SAM-dependent methyltransferase [Baekduia sp.]
MTGSSGVIWHDVECGGYAEDLPLWRELAAAAGGPVLDVGAGTGRVSLDLASRGFEVVALDIDGELLAALRERAASAGLSVQTVCADARAFDLGAGRFGLIAVPMQTLQLLEDAEARTAFLRCARRGLREGGVVAAALADALESFDAASDALPEPDVATVAGITYTSLPLAVVDEGDRAAIHRLRQVSPAANGEGEHHDVVRLTRLDAATLAEEAAAVGLEAETARRIPATDVYVGSTLVVLRG